jgi:hypothetical protein
LKWEEGCCHTRHSSIFKEGDVLVLWKCIFNFLLFLIDCMGQQIVYKDEASAGDRDNAISAKELAATSEEISGMSKDLHHLVAAFKTDD